MKNRSIADALSDFHAANLVHKHLYETACEQCAGLEQMRGQIAVAALAKMERALNGTDDAVQDAELKMLYARQEEILQAQVKTPQFHCAACRDTGYIADGYCNCLLRQIYTACYAAVDIDTIDVDFTKFDLAVFDAVQEIFAGKTQRWLAQRAKDSAIKYIEEFPNQKRRNMLLTGKAGLGKTFLLQCMAKEANKRNIDVLFMRANELFRMFFDHRMGEEVDLSFLHNAKLLLIDDLGTEPTTNNVSNEYFYELIEKRFSNGLHTVIATNVDNLLKRYDERISSRLESKDDCIQLLFDGSDLRAR